MLRITQPELNEKIHLHGMWLRSEEGGVRCGLRWANLSNSNLSGANLSNSDLIGADLSGVDLRNSDLGGADLRNSHLEGANLSNSNLSGADLRNSDLEGANLSGVWLGGTHGNGSEIKSAFFDRWPMTWTEHELQIGCQRHPLSMWRRADPRWIAAMDLHASEWWGRHGETVLALIGRA